MEQAAKPAEAPKPKNKNMVLAIIIIVILVVVGVGVYFLTRSTTSPPPPNGVPVSIFDGHTTCNAPVTPPVCGFSPANLRIKLGVNATVTWTNNGGLSHTVTSNSTANGSLPSFNSPAGGMNPGGSPYSFTFTQAGIYHYYCSYHVTAMQAVVNVTS